MADFADRERFPPYGRPVPESDRAHQLAREHARRRAEGDEAAERERRYGHGQITVLGRRAEGEGTR